ncbi:Hercynine oxygenase [subsurface metagenome]|nr:SUMF1/EgtB/PvdO family nonheme iron enzyme [bacterium]
MKPQILIALGILLIGAVAFANKVCPSCKYDEDDNLNYCTKCGTALVNSGYKTWQNTISIVAGQTETINATLEKESGSSDIEWCYVPAGWFRMGNTDSDADDDEEPEHMVYLDAYHISKYKVTNARFCVFLNAVKSSITSKAASEGGIDLYYRGNFIYWIAMDGEWIEMVGDASSFKVKNGYGNHPVIEATWYGAKAFAEWAGCRLPTEAEWEKAARGTDGRKYPWGNHDPYYNGRYYANYNPGDYSEDGYSRTSPVGSYPQGVSPYGCMDMAGNVCEWCADWYGANYYSSSSEHNPEGPSSGSSRVKRGGSWYADARLIRCADRSYSPPCCSRLGFRLSRD